MKAKLAQIGGWLTLCSGAVLTAFALATPVKGAAELKALDCACGGKELECVCKDPKCCPDDICDHKGSK